MPAPLHPGRARQPLRTRVLFWGGDRNYKHGNCLCRQVGVAELSRTLRSQAAEYRVNRAQLPTGHATSPTGPSQSPSEFHSQPGPLPASPFSSSGGPCSGTARIQRGRAATSSSGGRSEAGASMKSRSEERSCWGSSRAGASSGRCHSHQRRSSSPCLSSLEGGGRLAQSPSAVGLFHAVIPSETSSYGQLPLSHLLAADVVWRNTAHPSTVRLSAGLG